MSRLAGRVHPNSVRNHDHRTGTSLPHRAANRSEPASLHSEQSFTPRRRNTHRVSPVALKLRCPDQRGVLPPSPRSKIHLTETSILFHLHAEGAPRGITDIGRALGLPKSTAHRMVTALGRRGLVESDAQGRYRPGTALVSLGLGVLEHEPVVALRSRAASLQ